MLFRCLGGFVALVFVGLWWFGEFGGFILVVMVYSVYRCCVVACIGFDLMAVC